MEPFLRALAHVRDQVNGRHAVREWHRRSATVEVMEKLQFDNEMLDGRISSLRQDNQVLKESSDQRMQSLQSAVLRGSKEMGVQQDALRQECRAHRAERDRLEAQLGALHHECIMHREDKEKLQGTVVQEISVAQAEVVRIRGYISEHWHNIGVLEDGTTHEEVEELGLELERSEVSQLCLALLCSYASRLCLALLCSYASCFCFKHGCASRGQSHDSVHAGRAKAYECGDGGVSSRERVAGAASERFITTAGLCGHHPQCTLCPSRSTQEGVPRTAR